jgi:hypothetical protein
VVVVLIFVPFTLEAHKMFVHFKAGCPADYQWPDLQDFWFTGVVMVLLMIIQKIIQEICYPFFYKICKEKNDEVVRDLRTKKASKYVFKFLYMASATAMGWYTMKDSFILPPSLGGKGDLYNAFATFPYVELPSLYRLYFTGSMGYHLNGLITLLLEEEKQNDYVEMMFHHLVTFYLYGFSFLTNQIIGGVIAYLHDIADVGVSFTRIWSETEFKKTTAVLFALTIVAWFHTRLWVFA